MALWKSPYASGLAEFLGVLDGKTLEAIAITATANRLLPDNKQESIELILRYTENLPRLFAYKRMTSQVLYEYLHMKKVPVRIGVSKTELIDLVRGELEKSVKKSITSKAVAKKPNMSPAKVAQDTGSRTPAFAAAPPQYPQHLAVSPSVNLNLTSTNSNTSLNLSVNTAAASVRLDVQQGSGDVGGGETTEVFAREFCNWFYMMVNRLQPEASHLQGDTLNMDVFVANSSVDVYLFDNDKKVSEKHAMGQQDAFTTLRDTLVECGVCYSPNMESGVQCEMTSFGMAKVLCCGTLHRYEALVGLFEQEFGLVRSPEGRWKVMVLKLNLKQTQLCASLTN